MKDNFSIGSGNYLRFRPSYPKELLEFIISLTQAQDAAWDCGTGNGQIALELSRSFKQVYATDISEAQLKEAKAAPNIIYQVEQAEHSSFGARQFDLITVAQAVHWFDFDAFYKEVRRTLKPGGVLAVIGYGLIRTDAATDRIISHLYTETLGAYWDKERKYIDENYSTIPFPFKEFIAPAFFNEYRWTIGQLIGYLQTWSAVKHYIKDKKEDPVLLIAQELNEAWGAEPLKKISFPVFLRLAKIEN